MISANSDDILSDDLRIAIDWMAKSTPAESKCMRENGTLLILDRSARLCDIGKVDSWFSNADPAVANISAGVNRPLL